LNELFSRAAGGGMTRRTARGGGGRRRASVCRTAYSRKPVVLTLPQPVRRRPTSRARPREKAEGTRVLAELAASGRFGPRSAVRTPERAVAASTQPASGT